jgi:hypothetical protein
MLKRIKTLGEYKVLKVMYREIRILKASDFEILVHVSK